MHERFSAMLHEHMDVIDANGDKIGTIGKVYQPSRCPPLPAPSPSQLARRT